MNKLATDVFTNFELSALDYPRPINEEVHVLVLGNSGVGKSRLVNNICGSNIQTGISHQNLTLILSQFRSEFNRNLYLCDAPGVSSHPLNSSLMIQNALTCLPWNLIIIQSKLDARFSYKTLPELQTLARVFKKESSRVLLMVSCLDIEQKQSERKALLQKFKNQLQRCSFTQKLIVFSNKSSDFETISSILYKVGCQFPKSKLVFDNRKLLNLLGVDTNGGQLQNNQLESEEKREKILEQINKPVQSKKRKEAKKEIKVLNQQHNQNPINNSDIWGTEQKIYILQKIQKFTSKASYQFQDNLRPASCSKTKNKQHPLQREKFQEKIKEYSKPFAKTNQNASQLWSIVQGTSVAQPIIQPRKLQNYISQKQISQNQISQKFIAQQYRPQNHIFKTLRMFYLQFDKARQQLSVSQVGRRIEVLTKTITTKIPQIYSPSSRQDSFSNQFNVP